MHAYLSHNEMTLYPDKCRVTVAPSRVTMRAEDLLGVRIIEAEGGHCDVCPSAEYCAEDDAQAMAACTASVRDTLHGPVTYVTVPYTDAAYEAAEDGMRLRIHARRAVLRGAELAVAELAVERINIPE